MNEEKIKAYRPVNCTFMDWVEHFATLREVVTIVYLDKDTEQTISSQITTWIIKDGIEYLVIKESVSPIRMDMVLQVGAIKVADLDGTCSI